MTHRGRRASLPPTNYEPPEFTHITESDCVVDVYLEEHGHPLSFDFGRLPVHRDLQRAMARSFASLTGPSGKLRAIDSVQNAYRGFKQFSRFLATLAAPPASAADITISHVDRYLLSRRTVSSSGEVTKYDTSMLRNALLGMTDLSEPVRVHLMGLRGSTYVGDSHISSYTRDEMRCIVRAARKDLNAAADRIRSNLNLLSRWQRSEIDRTTDRHSWERGYLLNCLATTNDLPRCNTKTRQQTPMVQEHGGIDALHRAIHLSQYEVAAAVTLLVALTGVNADVLARATIAYERADSGSDEPAIVLIDLVKPRRGVRRRFMTLPFTNIPSAASEFDRTEELPSSAKALTSAQGIFSLALELTVAARAVSGSQKLFLWSGKGPSSRGALESSTIREGLPGFAPQRWGQRAGLTTDATDALGNPQPLAVNARRLRLTHVQRYQRPVAHSTSTLADSYLLRDRGAIVEYQQVVAKALDEQATYARQNLRLRVLSPEALERARQNPSATAHELGLPTTVLLRILDRSLDTVLASCIDFRHGPYTEDGEPCDRSFLVCLSCPCARATPDHLPALLVTREMLENRRMNMTPIAWVRLYGGPCAQLDDVIGHFDPTTIEAARSKINAQQRELIQRLLARELDMN